MAQGLREIRAIVGQVAPFYKIAKKQLKDLWKSGIISGNTFL
jgi:hypothetical protein